MLCVIGLCRWLLKLTRNLNNRALAKKLSENRRQVGQARVSRSMYLNMFVAIHLDRLGFSYTEI